MTVRTVACANCGARYRIPESFQGAKARCKGCGATIEIATSIVDPDAPKPAAKPAAPAKSARKSAAKPEKAPARSGRAAPKSAAKRGAGTRGKATAGSARRGASKSAGAEEEAEAAAPRARGARSSRASAGRGSSRAASRGSSRAGARGRRGGDDEAEAKSKAPIFIGSAIGVAVLGIAAFFLFGGDEKPKQDENTVAKSSEEAGDATKKSGAVADTSADKSATEAVAKKADEDKAAKEAAAKKEADAAAKSAAEEKAAAAKKDETAKKEPAAKGKVSPYDAKTELEPLEFPEDIDEELRKKVTALANTAVEDEGLAGQRALRELKKTPRAAFVAIVNELRKLDYMDYDYAMTGFTVHKAMEEMLMGRNVPYRVPSPGQPVKQDDAYWNAKCVAALHRFWNNNVKGGTKEGWDEWTAQRKKNLADAEKK